MAKKAKPLKASTSAAPANVVVPLPKRPDHSTAPPRSETQVFKFRLRNGFTGQTIVRNEEIDRLWYRVQQPDDFHPVIVFDSDARRMAINVRHLVASQFDLIGEDGLVAKDVDEGEFVEVYFADSKKPLRLDVEEDAVTLDEFDESGIDGDDDLCQLANFLFYLEAAHSGSDDASRLRISDGSILWFRLNDIAFFSVPLRLLAKPGSEAAQILAGKD
jgi:hypothetical protein